MITEKNIIRIGDDFSMGAYVQIIDTNYGSKSGEIIREQTAKIGEVVVENDVWIGTGARGLINCRVGDGATIGANAVVTEDIPSNAIAVGIPARVIKHRE